MSGETPSKWYSTCEWTGKRGYQDRAAARRVAANRLPGDHLREYFCQACNLWHIGHLPRVVRQGTMSAAAWYDF